MNSSLASSPTLRRGVTPPLARRTPNPQIARAAGTLMIAGAVLVTIGFVVLGSRFNYPDVLEEPANDILLRFHADAYVIGALFAGLAAASALLIPIAWLTRHLVAAGRSRTRRLMVAAGTAAGIVQVVGLLRWPLLIPNLADTVADPAASAAAKADAVHTFQILHTYLGGLVGEALGYALTATWTLAIIFGTARKPGRWFAPLGIASAVLIAIGLLEPLGIPAAGLANFIGYGAWSIWMIAFGTWLLRHPVSTTHQPGRSCTDPYPPASGAGLLRRGPAARWARSWPSRRRSRPAARAWGVSKATDEDAADAGHLTQLGGVGAPGELARCALRLRPRRPRASRSRRGRAVRSVRRRAAPQPV